MRILQILTGLTLLFVSCAPQVREVSESSLYQKELTGHTWRLRTGRGDYVFRFESSRVVFNVGRLGARFPIAATDDERRMIVIRHSGRFVPVWWRLGEDGILRMSRIDGQKMYANVSNAFAAPAPVEWLGLKPE